MTGRIVVTGTDTGIGKTVFAAGLADLLGARYWKPVQAGLEEETDSEAVMRLGGLSADRILPESYRLGMPASPHQAAGAEGVEILPARLAVPAAPGPLVIEGSGGLMVPLTRHLTFLDIFARWRLPVVLCSGTRLGTINHTLLSLDALRLRRVPALGVAFIGGPNAETQGIIAELGRVAILGRLPWIDPPDRPKLRAAFRAAFGTTFRTTFRTGALPQLRNDRLPIPATGSRGRA